MSDTNDFYGVGIGASAGGMKALQQFFSALPAGMNGAYFVITHLYSAVRSNLDNILRAETEMPVIRVGEDLALVHPNTVYILPENVMMCVEGRGLKVRERNISEVVNRAVDIFFRSLARNYGSRSIGVILSGTGSDGLAGANEIENAGGSVLVQSTSSAQFDGMPATIIRRDHPDAVAHPRELASLVAGMMAGARQKL